MWSGSARNVDAKSTCESLGTTGMGSKSKKVISSSSPRVGCSIVERLDSLLVEANRIGAIYQQKLTALTELKQSLLQKAFSGELTADKSVSQPTLKEEEIA
jgi:type I restriction enzyme S subunit